MKKVTKQHCKTNRRGFLVYEYPDVKSVVVCGDLHGKLKQAVIEVCCRNNMTDALVIVAGDCGFGFAGDNWDFGISEDFYNFIRKSNCYFAFVRGNHDNPVCFTEYPMCFSEYMSDGHLRTVPDYSVISACNHSILCVGGAVSIDRDHRTEGADWWMDEGPVLRTDILASIARNGIRIDTVVTHTAPSFCAFRSLPTWIKDKTLIADLHHKRKVMDGLLKGLIHDGHPLINWYYGHFHCSYQEHIDGVDYTMLDCMELKEIKDNNGLTKM